MGMDTSTMLIVILGAAVGLVLVAAFGLRFISWLTEFQHELRYINNEIGRTTGREKKRWKKRKRKLLLSILPFVRY